ncbi:MAG TPA: DUF4325 domain-containing protein [Candidatus Saccharimonadales bacterium]|nr:DUF4325 domain-containing protein [Candidatus Saccharimonadales bacterium]
MDIQEQIIQFARSNDKFRTSDIMRKLSLKVSRQYISSVLSLMVSTGRLIRAGSGEFIYYSLPEKAAALFTSITRKLKNGKISEDTVYQELESQSPIIKNLPENIASILFYAFTEMLNNAVDHSQSKNIVVELHNKDGVIEFIVEDYGVGVFRNVMNKKKLQSELDAIQDLLKGKTTTAPQAHSGEGIFFTSKIGDLFILESFGYRLRVDNKIQDVFIENIPSKKRGTRVTFQLPINSKKHLNDIFKEYQTDPEEYAFDKTEVKVKLYTLGTIYISRSQARRILSGLEKFKTIILDFDKVPTVGQAFADEIFRVFKSRHPEIEIKPLNMEEPVAFMINRVEKP